MRNTSSSCCRQVSRGLGKKSKGDRGRLAATAASAILALLGGVASAQAQPWGFAPPQAQPNWQFRPQEPTNARGVPPTQFAPAQPPAPSATATAPGASQMPAFPSAPGFAPPSGYPSGYPSSYPSGYPSSYPSGYPSGYPYGGATPSGWPAPHASSWGQAAPPTARAPRLELELSERQPYVQENILLRLKVVSDQNLATATPELPTSSDLLLHKLADAKVSTRTGQDGRREILNEFTYALIPLRAGNLSLPALRVTGEFAADAYGIGRGQRYDVSGGEGTLLQVRPALSTIQPWLPLRDLSLKASLDGGDDLQAGEPVSLVLELNAIGAGGNQLPSLEPYLESSDFRVYREQTLTEAKVSADGQRVEGQRAEYYTLVPQASGRLRLPEIRLPWWNVATSSREWASLPAELTGGAIAVGRARGAGFQDEGPGWIWLTLGGLLLLLLGYGGGLWYRDRLAASLDREALGARIGREARAAAGAARRRLIQARDRLHPAPALRRLSQALQSLLPASSQFLACLRAANQEQDPAVWAQRFQVEACRHLHAGASINQRGTLPGLAGQVQRLRPGADPEQLVRLLRQLDGALYGGQDIDFRRWKKEFARQVGRAQGLFRARGRRLRLERPSLPELNPRPIG